MGARLVSLSGRLRVLLSDSFPVDQHVVRFGDAVWPDCERVLDRDCFYSSAALQVLYHIVSELLGIVLVKVFWSRLGRMNIRPIQVIVCGVGGGLPGSALL